MTFKLINGKVRDDKVISIVMEAGSGNTGEINIWYVNGEMWVIMVGWHVERKSRLMCKSVGV